MIGASVLVAVFQWYFMRLKQCIRIQKSPNLVAKTKSCLNHYCGCQPVTFMLQTRGVRTASISSSSFWSRWTWEGHKFKFEKKGKLQYIPISRGGKEGTNKAFWPTWCSTLYTLVQTIGISMRQGSPNNSLLAFLPSDAHYSSDNGKKGGREMIEAITGLITYLNPWCDISGD